MGHKCSKCEKKMGMSANSYTSTSLKGEEFCSDACLLEALNAQSQEPSDVCDCDHCKLITSMISERINISEDKRYKAVNLCKGKVYGFVPDYWTLVDTQTQNKRRATGSREDMQFLAKALNAQSQEPSEGKREAPHPRNTSVGLFPEPSTAQGDLVERTVGKWLSAALDDPKVCDEMKDDIRGFFDELEQRKAALSGVTISRGTLLIAKAALKKLTHLELPSVHKAYKEIEQAMGAEK